MAGASSRENGNCISAYSGSRNKIRTLSNVSDLNKLKLVSKYHAQGSRKLAYQPQNLMNALGWKRTPNFHFGRGYLLCCTSLTPLFRIWSPSWWNREWCQPDYSCWVIRLSERDTTLCVSWPLPVWCVPQHLACNSSHARWDHCFRKWPIESKVTGVVDGNQRYIKPCEFNLIEGFGWEQLIANHL